MHGSIAKLSKTNEVESTVGAKTMLLVEEGCIVTHTTCQSGCLINSTTTATIKIHYLRIPTFLTAHIHSFGAHRNFAMQMNFKRED
jgi:hypothetical protein